MTGAGGPGRPLDLDLDGAVQLLRRYVPDADLVRALAAIEADLTSATACDHCTCGHCGGKLSPGKCNHCNDLER